MVNGDLKIDMFDTWFDWPGNLRTHNSSVGGHLQIVYGVSSLTPVYFAHINIHLVNNKDISKLS